MKINKMRKLNESKRLVEDDENPAVDVVSNGSGETTTVDVAVTSKSGDARPATTADKLNIENALTQTLDRALDDARYALAEKNFKANCNVLVKGLPGSSKTATIYNWANMHDCNILYLDAKNPDLQLLTSGGAVVIRTNPEKPTISNAYTSALDDLDRPNSILFLDELNRQTREYMRGSLLTLVADRKVAGIDETKPEGEQDGTRYFPNLLFTVAAINPFKDSDRGATELNDAEKRRFYYRCLFNSEVKTTKSYIKSYYDDKIKEYVADHPELTAEDIARINSFCLRQWIGLNILKHEDFHYTTIDEYMADTTKGQIMCQSILTELVDHSRGEKKRMLQDIETWSDLSEEAKVMLKHILDDLVIPSADAIRAAKGKELGLDLKTSSTAAPSTKDVGVDDEEEIDEFEDAREDDTDFGAGTADEKKKEMAKASDATIEKSLADLADSLTKMTF